MRSLSLLLILAASAASAGPDPLRAKADAENAAGTKDLDAKRPSRAAAHFMKAMQLAPDGRYSLNICLALQRDDPFTAVKACDAVFKLPSDDATKAKAGEVSARLRGFLANSVSNDNAAPVYPGFGFGQIGIGMKRKELEALKLPMVVNDGGWVCIKSEAKNDACTFDVRLVNDQVTIVELKLFRATQGASYGRQFLAFNTTLDEAIAWFRCGATAADEGGNSAKCGDGFSVTKGSGSAGVTLRQDAMP